MKSNSATRDFRQSRTGAHLAWTALLIFACPCVSAAQSQSAPPVASPAEADSGQEPALAHRPADQPEAKPTIALTVPQGTPIQVALDKETRVGKLGQPIRGRVIAPVYAFDKLVIPVGTEVSGRITKIEKVPGGERALSALDADFTPARKLQVAFDQIRLPSGRQMPVQTNVTPGSGKVIEFVAAKDEDQKKGATDAAKEKTKQARQQVKQEWNTAINEVKAPGKLHRLERFALAELPVHPQYINAGTVYFAELQEPLDFGSEPLTPETASSIGTAAPVDGSMVEARLVTPLNSATAQKGDEVEAIVSKPLFDGDRLIVPQGSRLKGSVVQVRAAHRPNRNGELRLVFHDLLLPEGVQQKVEASLAGVETAKADNVKLDSEGGARANAPKTRYLNTAISVGLAGLSTLGDPDAKTPNPAGNTSNRVAGGAGGFKAVGIVLGALVRSRALGYSMGGYGAGISVYTNFIARGHDVIFPKDTGMAIGIGTRPPAATPPPQPPASKPAAPGPTGA